MLNVHKILLGLTGQEHIKHHIYKIYTNMSHYRLNGYIDFKLRLRFNNLFHTGTTTCYPI